MERIRLELVALSCVPLDRCLTVFLAETGVLLCKLALLLDAAEAEWRKRTVGFASHHNDRSAGAKHPVKFNEKAKPGKLVFCQNYWV